MNPDYPNSWTTDEVIERLENMVAHYREWPEARILHHPCLAGGVP